MPCRSTNLVFPASPAFIPRPSCASPNSRASAIVFRAPRQPPDTPGHHPSIPFNPHSARVRRRAASFKSLYRKRAGAACPHIILLSMRASDTALGLLAHCRPDISTGRAVLDPGDFFPSTLLCTRNSWEANTGHLFGQEVALSRHCNIFSSRFESPEVPRSLRNYVEIQRSLQGRENFETSARSRNQQVAHPD